MELVHKGMTDKKGGGATRERRRSTYTRPVMGRKGGITAPLDDRGRETMEGLEGVGLTGILGGACKWEHSPGTGNEREEKKNLV